MLLLWAGIAAVSRGIRTSITYPTWLGTPAIGLGLAMVGVSLATIVGGPSEALALASVGPAGLTAIWSIVLGVSLARRRYAALASGNTNTSRETAQP
ncbi:MAG TPA: hypothetical protein VFZ72_10040 [Jiangellaceae bacterium]